MVILYHDDREIALVLECQRHVLYGLYAVHRSNAVDVAGAVLPLRKPLIRRLILLY